MASWMLRKGGGTVALGLLLTGCASLQPPGTSVAPPEGQAYLEADPRDGYRGEAGRFARAVGVDGRVGATPLIASKSVADATPARTPSHAEIARTSHLLLAAGSDADPDEPAPPPVAVAPGPSRSEPSPLLPADATSGAAVTSMTLTNIEQMALANNPTIKQLAASASEAAALHYQVGLKANPTAGYDGSQIADRGTDQHVAFVEQEFVRGGKLELNRAILSQSHQVQLWNVQAQRTRVLTDVRARFYEALAAQRQVELTGQFLEVIDRGVAVAEERRKAGEGTAVEVLQAKTQREQVDLARQRAEVAFRGAWQDLTAVAGVPSMAPVTLVAELRDGAEARDWDAAYGSLLAGSPELAAARARVQEARAYWERQKVQAVPNVTAQLAAGYDNGTDNSLINLQVGAPIPVHNRNEGNISAAYASYCRATQEVRRVEMAIKARLARGAQDYDAALASVNKFEQRILPQTREALDLSEQAYQGGELDFLQVLIVRRTYFDSNIEYVQALGDLAQARARVNGFLLTGGLDAPPELGRDDAVRGQAFSQQ